MPSIESRVEGAWVAKQTGKGSPAAAAVKRLRKIGGDMLVNRDDGSQNWSDGQRFSDAEDFANTLVGNGNPQLQAQPGTLAYLMYLMSGQESVTAVTGTAGRYDHVATPNNAGAFWSTWWKKVGESAVVPQRQKFNDCRMSSMRVEGSSAAKVCRMTPTWVSLDPGEVYVTDPVQAEDTDRSFLYTEGEGRFTINGATFRGHSSFAFQINDGVAPWYGDSVRPHDVVFGEGQIMLEGVTILVDQQGKDYYDEIIYGRTSPAAGVKPRTDIPLYGSYSVELKRGTRTDLAITGTPTGGTFTLTVDGSTTAPIAFNATATAVQSALTALATVRPGEVVATGGPLPGTGVLLTFLRSGVVVTATGTGLTGGTSPAVTVSDRGHDVGFKLEVPKVKWSPDLAIPGNPDGGPVELSLAGMARKLSATPMYTTTIRNGDPAYA